MVCVLWFWIPNDWRGVLCDLCGFLGFVVAAVCWFVVGGFVCGLVLRFGGWFWACG